MTGVTTGHPAEPTDTEIMAPVKCNQRRFRVLASQPDVQFDETQ